MILALVLFCVIYIVDGYLYHRQTPFAQTAYRLLLAQLELFTLHLSFAVQRTQRTPRF